MRHRIKKQITERMELLAGVSHDLRTPITRMKLQLAMINEKKNLTSNLEEDLDEMEEMIKGYLEFAKDDREEEMVEANLFKIIQQAAKLSDPSQNKIEISPTSSDLPIFPMQVRSINEALTNLFNNAIKYAGKAKVSTRLFDDHCEVLIDDNGPGISREKREEAILPFNRLENSRNKDTGGIGLGLSIAYNAILSHGGELFLDDSPMGGLRVRILLPI